MAHHRVCCCSYCVKLSERMKIANCSLSLWVIAFGVRVCRRSNLSLSCHLSTYSMNWKLHQHVEVNWKRRTDEDCGAIMQHILSTSLWNSRLYERKFSFVGVFFFYQIDTRLCFKNGTSFRHMHCSLQDCISAMTEMHICGSRLSSLSLINTEKRFSSQSISVVEMMRLRLIMHW